MIIKGNLPPCPIPLPPSHPLPHLPPTHPLPRPLPFSLICSLYPLPSSHQPFQPPPPPTTMLLGGSSRQVFAPAVPSIQLLWIAFSPLPRLSQAPPLPSDPLAPFKCDLVIPLLHTAGQFLLTSPSLLVAETEHRPRTCTAQGAWEVALKLRLSCELRLLSSGAGETLGAWKWADLTQCGILA